MIDQQILDELRKQLGALTDPELGETLAALEAIHAVEVNKDTVEVYLELIPPIHRTLAQQLDGTIRETVQQIVPQLLCVVHARPRAIRRLQQTTLLPQVQDTVAVASGKGGVGKSTVAANLAACLFLEGLQVGLLDADIYGPSAPTLFGLEGATLRAEKRADGRIVGYPHEPYGIKVASMGFIMEPNQAAIFRGPMLAGYFRTLVEQIEWGQLDVLVFDLPPGTGDVQLTLAQQVPLSGAVIVTTPHRLAVADVRRSIAMFRRVNVEVLGIIENMSYYVPPDAPDKRYYVFGKGGGQQLAEEVGVPYLGEIPLHDDIRIHSDEGLPAVLDPDTDQHIHQAYRGIAHAVISRLRVLNRERYRVPPMEIRL